ncbi:MAG: hypothetical protein KBC17_00460 [Candidatus Pacebacteria bacterium]|nr:hypothetical protein [Candidatus Paceibacterota bacterium]
MKQKIFFTVIAFISFALSSQNVFAASLNLSPSVGSYAVRQTFTVDVIVSSTDQAVNAFSGDITYPSDKLYAVSVSKIGSIVNFWTAEPKISKGAVHYEGVALNPGFTGARAKIIRITFRALQSGTAVVRFSSGSVLANDGLGTSVISSTGQATYTITKAIVEEDPTPATGNEAPNAPQITSGTHPDQSTWYPQRVVELAWNIPSDATAVSYITNQNPLGTPTALRGLAKDLTTAVLPDGIWYTHVRLRNKAGWSSVATYRTQIDATIPTDLVVKQVTGPDEPIKKLALSASDSTSGIVQFGVIIDGKGETIIPADDGNAQYSSEKLPKGEHILLVKAYDRAGNFAVYNGSFVTTKFEAPVITDYQKELKDKDFLVIRGTSYPSMDVEFSLVRQTPVEKRLFGKRVYETEGEPIVSSTKSNIDGNFIFAYPLRLDYGLYRITARAVLPDGTGSDFSPVIAIPVIENLFMRIVHFIITPTVLACVALFGMILCIILLIKTHRQYRKLQVETASLMRHNVDSVGGQSNKI